MSKYLFFGVLFLASTINAAVIDFESATTSSGCDVNNGGAIDGFTLGAFDGNSGAGINSATTCSITVPAANSGNNYALNFNSVIGELTRDVGVFDLSSLFVHADRRIGDSTVRFQGLDGVDGNVLYSLDVDITAAWQQVVFAGWVGIKTFTWDSLTPGSSNIAIDDFAYDEEVAAVPEPASLVLLALGLAGLGFSRRRKA